MNSINIELQQYLITYGLASLQAEFKIKINRHQNFTNLVCLKYSQLESPLTEKIVQQCRGIILDEANNWEIISYPYDKFFNYGESSAAKINWNNALVYEKLDGSLMTLYFYRGEWRVQSSGTADATGKVNIKKYTFQQLFWQVWQQLNYQLPTETEYCFMFELMTPYNRIVVRQLENNLVLHGVRNLQTQQESNLEFWQKKYNWQIVKTYPFNDLNTIIQATENLNPMEGEGYIVCDRDFNRIKVKSTDYVAFSHERSALTSRKILNIVITNEGAEFLTYFPEYSNLYQQMLERYQNLVAEIEMAYRKYRNIPLQKDFALAIKHLPYTGTLFALRSGKTNSVKESLKNTSLTKLESLLKLEFLDFSI